MPLIQQITNIININLLWFLSTGIISSLLINHILRNVTKSNYSYWIDCLFTLGCLFMVILFRSTEVPFVLMLFAGLFALSIVDIFCRVLPNIINFTLLIVGLMLSLQDQFIPITQAILGILVGYFILWTISWGYRDITGQIGMGGGDLKLVAALGAWIGFEGILYVLFWSSLLGCGFYGIMVIRGKYNKTSKIPFGLFLSIVGMSIFVMRFSLWHL